MAVAARMDDSEPPLPFFVPFAATIYFLLGGFAVVRIVAAICQGGMFWDFSALGLLIGHGLLRGYETSRKWAVWLSGFGAVALLFGIAFDVGFWDLDSRGAAAWIARGETAVHLILCGMIFYGLRTGVSRAWFSKEGRSFPSAGSWGKSLAVVSLFTAVLVRLTAAKTEGLAKEQAEAVFRVRTEFSYLEAGTEKPLADVRMFLPGIDSAQLATRSLEGHRRIAGAEGMEIDGIATGPFDVRFEAEGYATQSVRVTRATPTRVVLKFVPSR